MLPPASRRCWLLSIASFVHSSLWPSPALRQLHSAEAYPLSLAYTLTVEKATLSVLRTLAVAELPLESLVSFRPNRPTFHSSIQNVPSCVEHPIVIQQFPECPAGSIAVVHG